MRVWLVMVAEPLPGVDGDCREWRCGMLARTLVARGHDVTWWTSAFDHFRKKHRSYRSQSIEVQKGFGLRLLCAPGYKKNISLRRVFHNVYVARVFEREADDTDAVPSVVFACIPTLELAQKALEYAKARDLPVIIDVRDQWPELYLNAFPPRFHRFARFALSSEFRRARRILGGATSITAVSETSLGWALRHARRPMRETDRVFPLGHASQAVDATTAVTSRMAQLRAEHNIQSDALVVTFIGTFGASYNLDLVIEASRILQSEGRSIPVQVVLAGDGSDKERLQKTARGLKNVIFTGWLDRTSLEALTRLSSVGLAAYKRDALQSLPNKVFDYMAAGLPILSSLRGELETLVRDRKLGLQYDADDPVSLLESIRWFLDNPQSRVAMGARGRALFKERFAAEAIYRDLVEHIEEVASAQYGSSAGLREPVNGARIIRPNATHA